MCGQGMEGNVWGRGREGADAGGEKMFLSVFVVNHVGLFYLYIRSLLTHAYLRTVRVTSVPGMCQCL